MKNLVVVASLAISCSLAGAFVVPGPSSSQLSQTDSLRQAITSQPCTSTTTTSTSLNLFPADEQISPILNQASTFLATIDSDIASIPDDQFGKVFAGGAFIMFGSIISTIIVGFLLESGGGGYADIVAETYAEQNYGDEEESFLDSLKLTSDQKEETKEMVRAFREKKMKKAGTWTEDDEKKKQQEKEEKDMFSDYDE